MSEYKKWLKQLASLSSATMISRVLGFVRELVFAMVFGASAVFDGYITASRIPNMLRRLFAEGALTQAFVPVLIQIRQHEDSDSLRHFQNAMLSILLIATLVIAILFCLFPKPVVSLYAFGFSENDPRLAIAAGLLPILSFFLPLISLISFYAALLNSHRRFFLAGLLPAISNIVLISVALNVTSADEGIWSLSWALIGGAVIQLLLVFFQTWYLFGGVWPTTSFNHPALKKVFKMLAVGLFGLSAVQISLFIDGNLASYLPTGSLSWLYYAERLIYLPLGTVGVSLASVSLPLLSEAIAQKNNQVIQYQLHRSAHMVFLLGVPAALALFFLADPMISILFERGAFTAHDTQMSAFALRYFSVGVPFMMLIKLWVSVAYSYQQVQLTVWAAFIAILSNVLIVIVSMPYLDHGAIGLAVSSSAFLQSAYLYFKLKKLTGMTMINMQYFVRLSGPVAAFLMTIWAFRVIYQYQVFPDIVWLTLTVLGSMGVYFLAYFWSKKAPC
ncbi:murein biosynthesis integral membrane protein MurJ [Gammaproteobacteria bacterium]|nr:murein biosynthesis integral membrane protein MurJ [Gammaproteobacteria bacterium]